MAERFRDLWVSLTLSIVCEVHYATPGFKPRPRNMSRHCGPSVVEVSR